MSTITKPDLIETPTITIKNKIGAKDTFSSRCSSDPGTILTFFNNIDHPDNDNNS